MSARTHRKNSYALPFATRAHESIFSYLQKDFEAHKNWFGIMATWMGPGLEHVYFFMF
jgi:hypothetical protein